MKRGGGTQLCYIWCILVTLLEVLQFWFSSNRNPWLSSLNAGHLSFTERLNCEILSEFWPLTFNHCLAPSKVWTLTQLGCFYFYFKKKKRYLFPLWAPSWSILSRTDTNSVTTIILSVPFWCEVLESFVTSELGSSAVRRVESWGQKASVFVPSSFP